VLVSAIQGDTNDMPAKLATKISNSYYK
jgi:hypothetical protein